MGRTIVNRRNLANFGGNIQPAATPIDTYYRPIKQTPPENEAVAGIINALKMVNPALEKYGDRVAKVASDEEFAAGQKEYDLMSPEDRKKALADIKSGKMSEVESPFWVRGFAKNLLASEAYKFGESLSIEYEKKKNEVTADGNSLFDWMATKKAEFIKANGLQGFAPDVLESHFMTPVRQFEQNTLQKHTAFKVKKIKDQNEANFRDSLVAPTDGYVNNIEIVDDKLQRDTLTGEFIKATNFKIQTHIDEGNDPKETLDGVEQMFKDKIREEYRDGNSELAEHIYRKALLEIKGKEGKFGDYKRDKLEQWWESVKEDELNESSKRLENERKVRKERMRVGSLKIREFIQSSNEDFNPITFGKDERVPQDLRDEWIFISNNETEYGSSSLVQLSNDIQNKITAYDDTEKIDAITEALTVTHDYQEAEELLEAARIKNNVVPTTYSNFKILIDKAKKDVYDVIDPDKTLDKMIKDMTRSEEATFGRESYDHEHFEYAADIRNKARKLALDLKKQVADGTKRQGEANVEFGKSINGFKLAHKANLEYVKQKDILEKKKDYFWENTNLGIQKRNYSSLFQRADIYRKARKQKLILESQGQQNTHEYSNVLHNMKRFETGFRSNKFYKNMIANRQDKNNTIDVLNQQIVALDKNQPLASGDPRDQYQPKSLDVSVDDFLRAISAYQQANPQ